MDFFKKFYVLTGLLLILYAISIMLIPLKFGSIFGVSTKTTLKNELMWAAGQKLFAISYIVAGVFSMMLALFNFQDKWHPALIVIILIGIWAITKLLVNKILLKRFPDA